TTRMAKVGPTLAASALHSAREGDGTRATTTTSALVAVNINALELRGWKFLFTWTGIVSLHSVCAVYLTQLARVYSFFMDPYMTYWTTLIARDRHQYFRHVGVVFGLIAALHWWQLLCILWASFRAKELVLLDGSSSVASKIPNWITEKLAGQRQRSSLSSILGSARLRKLALPSRVAFQVWRFFFGRHGVFGIESDFFPVVFIIRELVEIVSQTFQAHRSSESLPRPWLNNLFVTLVVVNCWSTPILQHICRHHQGMERVGCLILDVVLNVGSSVVIPTIIFLPYYEAFMPAEFSFPYDSLYDALFFSRLVMENQLLFSLSSVDVLSRLVPHVGIFSSLASAATLIHRKGSRRVSRVLSTDAIKKPKPTTHFEMVSSSNAVMPTSEEDTTAAHASHKKTTLVHAFFFVWGLVVLILHVRGVLRAQATVLGCRQVTGSWFTKDYPCSVYTYNCYRQGTVTPDEDSWSLLDQSSLVYLTIAHCPELRVPHRFQSFPNLLGLQLHNTTIVEWKKEDAISATRHTKMVVLVIAKTNMTRIPDGMLEPLPESLVNIEITHTNLTSLPDDLHEKWHPLGTMYLEHSLITEFPKVLLALQVADLSLHGNLIERLPEFETTHQFFYSFVASANPLVELPETLGDGTVFSFFAAENTLIKTLPAWTHTSVELSMYLYGTPYCETQTGDVFDGTNLECVTRDNRIEGKCPFEIFDPRIPL
ncbi:hypothetical protein Gpo141_00014237, partial [Globisporangium polare]